MPNNKSTTDHVANGVSERVADPPVRHQSSAPLLTTSIVKQVLFVRMFSDIECRRCGVTATHVGPRGGEMLPPLPLELAPSVADAAPAAVASESVSPHPPPVENAGRATATAFGDGHASQAAASTGGALGLVSRSVANVTRAVPPSGSQSTAATSASAPQGRVIENPALRATRAAPSTVQPASAPRAGGDGPSSASLKAVSPSAHGTGPVLTLEGCLAHYFAPHIIEGRRCSHCHAVGHTRERAYLASLPPILLIILKRFEMRPDMTVVKRRDPVLFPLIGLDMAPYLHPAALASASALLPSADLARAARAGNDPSAPSASSPAPALGALPSVGGTMYDLFAVVLHHGEVHSGHYVTVARPSSLHPTHTPAGSSPTTAAAAASVSPSRGSSSAAVSTGADVALGRNTMERPRRLEDAGDGSSAEAPSTKDSEPPTSNPTSDSPGWHVFDDSSVSPLKDLGLLQSRRALEGAYVLMYSRRLVPLARSVAAALERGSLAATSSAPDASATTPAAAGAASTVVEQQQQQQQPVSHLASASASGSVAAPVTVTVDVTVEVRGRTSSARVRPQ